MRRVPIQSLSISMCLLISLSCTKKQNKSTESEKNARSNAAEALNLGPSFPSQDPSPSGQNLTCGSNNVVTQQCPDAVLPHTNYFPNVNACVPIQVNEEEKFVNNVTSCTCEWGVAETAPGYACPDFPGLQNPIGGATDSCPNPQNPQKNFTKTLTVNNHSDNVQHDTEEACNAAVENYCNNLCSITNPDDPGSITCCDGAPIATESGPGSGGGGVSEPAQAPPSEDPTETETDTPPPPPS